MARLNGTQVSFVGLTYREIGKLILRASPSGDGRGIVLELTEEEEITLGTKVGMMVGQCLADLVADAIETSTGRKPQGLGYRYEGRTFTAQRNG